MKQLLLVGLCVTFLSVSAANSHAQVRVGYGAPQTAAPAPATNELTDYTNPKEYTINSLTLKGTRFLDPNSLLSLTGLRKGDKIRLPGEAQGSAIRKLMDSGLLFDVVMKATKIEGSGISLLFTVNERPRLFQITYTGVRKGESESLKEKVKLTRGKIITNTDIKNAQLAVRRYYIEKGYLNAKVKVTTIPDSTRNNATMRVQITKGEKVKINNIEFSGRTEVEESALRTKMKSTKQMRFGRLFSPSKFVPKKFEEDKGKLVDYYNKLGYRDAVIEKDSIINNGGSTVGIKLNLAEGKKYYYRNVNFEGNYLHTSDRLREVLAIRKGEVYNPEELDKKLQGNPGQDLSSLYMDDGYLYYRAEPVERAVVGDSIDLDIRIFEGKQATINRIILNGNTKTSDHVVMRQIRTLPGQKFSKTAIIRTQRELSTLGYFDPEKIGINPIPQPDGTVDIEYNVEEKPNDQIELSGGWGGFIGFVGTLGLTFNNFSARNIPNLSAWRPLPAGDGQRLSLRFQANGRQFQTYSATFTEPWLGGRKPNALSISLSHSILRQFGADFFSRGSSNAQPIGSFGNTAITIGLGRQLKVPDDYFSLSNSISYQRYDLNNSAFLGANFSNGISNNFTFNTTLSRNSIDNPQFPRLGSSFTLSGTFTPPYSVFRAKDFQPDQANPFRWVEYHKWMFDASWFQTAVGKFVINARAHMGFLGNYNARTPIGPFERFVVGGAGLAGQGQFALAQDIVGLRGYPDRRVITLDNNRAPTPTEGSQGGVVYSKYVAELRYPVSLNPSATIFLLGFMEAGNNWASYKQYNPFDLRRSAGAGARIFMPAFGLIGIDYGWGFDDLPGVQKAGTGQFHFTIGQQFR